MAGSCVIFSDMTKSLSVCQTVVVLIVSMTLKASLAQFRVYTTLRSGLESNVRRSVIYTLLHKCHLVLCLFSLSHRIKSVIHTTWDNWTLFERPGWFSPTRVLTFHLVVRGLLKSSFPFMSRSHPLVRVCAPRHPESLMMRDPSLWESLTKFRSLLTNSRSVTCNVK